MSSLCADLCLKIVTEVFATFFSSLFSCTMFLPFSEPPHQLSLCLMCQSEENRKRFAMAGFEKAVSLSLLCCLPLCSSAGAHLKGAVCEGRRKKHAVLPGTFLFHEPFRVSCSTFAVYVSLQKVCAERLHGRSMFSLVAPAPFDGSGGTGVIHGMNHSGLVLMQSAAPLPHQIECHHSCHTYGHIVFSSIGQLAFVGVVSSDWIK